MPEVTLNGCKIVYEERGTGTPVVLTPGGRWGGYVQRVVADKLAVHYRVITWDRRNCDGASDIIIKGDESEADVWCDDLAALIRTLGIGPCYLGEYAGCRTSPLVCIKHPDLVKGLLLAWPSGGPYPAARLPTNIYQPYNRAAIRRGMEGVVETHSLCDLHQEGASQSRPVAANEPARIHAANGILGSVLHDQR